MNKSMRRGGFRISGAMGALPIWTDYAKGLIKELKFKDFLDPTAPNMVGYQTWPTVRLTCSSPLSVDLPAGLVLQGGGDADGFEFTNFDKEGETFHDEFARSTAFVPMSMSLQYYWGARTPRRAFQP